MRSDLRAIDDLTLQLSMITADMLCGRFSGVGAPPQVGIRCDGRHWASVPVTTDDTGAHFTCQLPPAAWPQSTKVEIRSVSGEDLYGSFTAPTRKPITNLHGLGAIDVLKHHPLPFSAVPYMSFDGARLVVTGEHLPPAGDPGALTVVFGPGVAYEFKYPLPSMAFGNHFWYWPNAHLSAFQLIIDLPACAPGSDPFRFRFEYSNGNPLDPTALQVGDVLGRQVFIPPRLDAGIGLPRDNTQLTRVQTWSSDQSVTVTGYNAFRAIEALLARHGVTHGPEVTILDWGCGHGRVTRHFLQNWPQARIHGTDIDGENIAWCQRNLTAGSFATAPLVPPTEYPAASLDGVFGISVMTHLTAEVQAAWLDEFARLLKPEGIALITFGGKGAAAWSTVFRGRDWWERWLETEFDDHQLDAALDGKIADKTYYRHTAQTAEYTQGFWSKHLEILEIIPDYIGNLDVAVMRKRRQS